MVDWDYIIDSTEYNVPDSSLPYLNGHNQLTYYRAIAATEHLLSEAENPRQAKVQICTSTLVSNQVMGKWQVNDSILFMLCAKLRSLLSEFKEWEAVCNEREEIA